MRIIRFRFRAVMHRAFVIKVVNGSGTYFIFITLFCILMVHITQFVYATMHMHL